MEMLDILKARLPEGLSIVKVWDRAGSNQMKIRFSYNGHEHIGWLNKTCTPGHAEKNCDFSICAVMMVIALERNDLVSAKHWSDKQIALSQI